MVPLTESPAHWRWPRKVACATFIEKEKKMIDSPVEKAVHAYVQAHGDDLFTLEVAAHVVVRSMVTDLMRYCDDLNAKQDRSGYVPLNAEKILDDARDVYARERAA
jgi:hypothetical protein